MKYIKLFNESNNFLTYREIMEEIKEILLPISDLGWEIGIKLQNTINWKVKTLEEMTKDIDTNFRMTGPNIIYVRVVRYDEPALVWNKEIESEFNRLQDYSLENGFKLSKVYYVSEEPDGRNDRKIVSYDSFLKNIGNQRIVNLLFELEQITK